MILKYLLTNIEDGILTISINRPKKYNALNIALLQEIGAVLHLYKTSAEVKGVVLTGVGEKAFAAGADIAEFAEFNGKQGKAMAIKGGKVFDLIETYPKPIIAAVNGYALGGGCELTMACHIRVAAENAIFGQPEVNLGLIPGYGGTQRLVQLIGKGKALELLMTGDNVKADEALRLGLVNYVVPQAELIEKCKGILRKIMTKAPVAIAEIIAAVGAHFTDGVNGFDAEIEAFGACFLTEDFKEGTSAFVEKRRPKFIGK